MKHLAFAFSFLLLFASSSAFCEEEQLTPQEEKYLAWARELWSSLDRRQGKIDLPNNVATLEVPESFYYLDPDDAEKVLVKVWENPPGSGNSTLGMLFPARYTPFDQDAWAVTIEYNDDGHVSDEDADEIDYQALLAQMKKDTRVESEDRVKRGYDSIELTGWASRPFYDKDRHVLHWAKEFKVGDDPHHTLNYNIRVLGRKGVLVLNFIAGMDQKASIDSQIDSVLSLARFDQGSRYEDFVPGVDKVAAYGIGALIAGKILAKTGLFAAALIFLKKFGVLIVVAVGAFLRKLFKRNKA